MNEHLYFIGIAGHAMRGLALAAKQRGYTITGLDEAAVPPGSDWLDENHLEWHRFFEPGQLDGVSRVILSGGTPSNHSAIDWAKSREISVISFAQFLGEITVDKQVVSVAGTHGKTTTTSLIAWLFEYVGMKPDFLIGIKPFNFDSSARLAGSKLAIIEGDEYKASNLEDKSKVEYYHPNTLILTSVEHDHPDVFRNAEASRKRFERIVGLVPQDGMVIACADDDAVLQTASLAKSRVIGYGLDGGDYIARNVAYLPNGLEFDLETSQGIIGHIAIGLYGKHNVLNTLAAIAAGAAYGLDIHDMIAGCATFLGAYRRFNIINGQNTSITVIDDYAHHPTEVAATIVAARLHFKNRRIIALFKPHTYSRTQALLHEYSKSFGDADKVYISEIEGARESFDSSTVTSRDLVELIPNSSYVDSREDMAKQVRDITESGDVVVCMSVSGYQDIAGELAGR